MWSWNFCNWKKILNNNKILPFRKFDTDNFRKYRLNWCPTIYPEFFIAFSDTIMIHTHHSFTRYVNISFTFSLSHAFNGYKYSIHFIYDLAPRYTVYPNSWQALVAIFSFKEALTIIRMKSVQIRTRNNSVFGHFWRSE